MPLDLIGLYFGPDQMMPVASILATLGGLLLIFWNKVVGLRRITGLSRRSSAIDKVAHATDSSSRNSPRTRRRRRTVSG